MTKNNLVPKGIGWNRTETTKQNLNDKANLSEQTAMVRE
jgi:hypothetical protein